MADSSGKWKMKNDVIVRGQVHTGPFTSDFLVIKTKIVNIQEKLSKTWIYLRYNAGINN